MRYNKIRKMDISNGPGLRVSIFTQGCAFNCPNCFNPETHDFTAGKEFTNETLNKILDLCDNENIEGLSILGGEPMHPTNIEGTTKLAKAFKEKYPNKTVWSWSGYTFDSDLKDKEVVVSTLEVRSHNESAINLYLKHGYFKEIIKKLIVILNVL